MKEPLPTNRCQIPGKECPLRRSIKTRQMVDFFIPFYKTLDFTLRMVLSVGLTITGSQVIFK